MWQAIQYVGTGLSLVAFVVAAITFAYRARLKQRAKIILSAPAKERVDAIAATAEWFRVDVSGLSQARQQQIVLEQIRARTQRNLLVAGVTLFLAVILGVIAIISIVAPKPPGPDMRAKLIGSYQVILGPNGGCNGGRPGTYPSNPARIMSDGSNLTAYNECGNSTTVNISGDNKTIYFYGESAQLDFTGPTLTIRDQAGNTWQKIP
jgi:hypothetical protein